MQVQSYRVVIGVYSNREAREFPEMAAIVCVFEGRAST